MSRIKVLAEDKARGVEVQAKCSQVEVACLKRDDACPSQQFRRILLQQSQSNPGQ